MRSTLYIVKSIIYGVLLGGLAWFGLRYLDTVQRTNARNFAVDSYSNGEYRESAATFLAVWNSEPVKAPLNQDIDTFHKAALEAGQAAYEGSLRGGIGIDDAIWLLEAAERYGELDDKSRGYLCDAYIKSGEFAKAHAMLDGARSGGATFARMKPLQDKLVRFESEF